MKNSTLYIIGNGFDIYHGINSRYSDFKIFAKSNNIQLYEKIESYYSSDDYWSDFESSLAALHYESVIDCASDFLLSYGADEWSDAYHHNYQYEIENIINILTDEMLSTFWAWLKQLTLDEEIFFKRKLDYISPNGIFLSFNYTSTLENYYSVDSKNINYIHGCVDHEGDDIILGHGWSPEERKSLNSTANQDIDDEYFNDIDPRIYEGNTLIDSYFLRTYKPTRKIIEDNMVFFENLSKITRIYVLGHSISEVDIEYFKKIVSSVDVKTTEWYVSFYGELEQTHHKTTLNDIGVPSDLIYLHPINNMPKI